MVDNPPIDELHSLAKRETFNFEPDPLELTRVPRSLCDVSVIFEDACNKITISLNEKSITTDFQMRNQIIRITERRRRLINVHKKDAL